MCEKRASANHELPDDIARLTVTSKKVSLRSRKLSFVRPMLCAACCPWKSADSCWIIPRRSPLTWRRMTMSSVALPFSSVDRLCRNLSRATKSQDDGSWLSGMSECDIKFYSLIIADTLASGIHVLQECFDPWSQTRKYLDSIPTLFFAKFCKDKTYTFCETPNYVAPEIVLS